MSRTFASNTNLASSSGKTSASARPLIESDRVEGTEVYGTDDSHLGSIKRLMIDKTSGRVGYAVIEFGGFLGMGTDTYTVPWAKLAYDTTLGGYRTDLSPDQVKSAPDFYRKGNYAWSDRNREQDLHSYYGVSPYWGL